MARCFRWNVEHALLRVLKSKDRVRSVGSVLLAMCFPLQ